MRIRPRHRSTLVVQCCRRGPDCAGSSRLLCRQCGLGALGYQPSLLLGRGGIKLSMKGSTSRASSATMNRTRWAIRPATKATSRDNRSSLATTTLHFSCLRRRQGSCQLRTPFQRVGPFATFEFDEFSRNGHSLRRGKLFDCGPLRIDPRPVRCCCRVETLRYAITCSMTKGHTTVCPLIMPRLYVKFAVQMYGMPMAATAPTTDIHRGECYFRFVPLPDSASEANSSPLDDQFHKRGRTVLRISKGSVERSTWVTHDPP